jgi:AAA domain
MNEDVIRELAASSRGAMIAAAGFGKTHTIATAVASHSSGRELVLTHTHAGVDALRHRLSDSKASSRTFHIDTIAGWALRLAAAFPSSSGFSTSTPRHPVDYLSVYRGATALLQIQPIQEVIRASFSGVYVDEYQDCTIEQHRLVMALADLLKCRLVGDPLQGIFAFGDNKIVDWVTDVAATFREVPGPQIAWRWKATNPSLGEWLQDARQRLLQGQPLDLQGSPVMWVASGEARFKQVNQRTACLNVAGKAGDSVVAIHQWAPQCHELASGLKGIYSCVEAIDSQDLYDAASAIDLSHGFGRAVAILEFSGKCMTQVKGELATIRGAMQAGRLPNVKKHAGVRDALSAVAGADWLNRLAPAFAAVRAVQGAVIYRRELWDGMEKALELFVCRQAESLSDAVWVVRNRARIRGRRMPRCAIGTTLLVKGLQFDHAIVLQADGHDAKNLYVALTRGARSLTVISESTKIVPAAP